MMIYTMAVLRSYWHCLSVFVGSFVPGLAPFMESKNQYLFLVAAAALRTQYKLVMQLVGVRIMESLITVSRLDSRFSHLEAESKME
jgi:hypothetical protein